MSDSIDINLAFKTLNLEPGVSQEEIKQAYRQLVKEWHPDRFLEPAKKLAGEEKIKLINQSYELLKSYHSSNKINSKQTNSASSSTKPNIYSQTSNSESFYQKGMKNAQNKQYSQAIEDFTLAIRLNKNYIEAYKFRALACEKLGYINRAQSDYQKVLELELIQKKNNRKKYSDNYYDLEGFVNPSTSSNKSNEVSPWKIIKTLNHGNSISVLAVSPDGNLVASGGIDHKVTIWNLNTEKSLHIFTKSKQNIRCLTFSQDNQIIASGNDDGSIFVWQLSTKKLINQIKVHSAPVYSVIISPDNQTIISGSGDTTIKISHILMGEILQVIKAHTDAVCSLAISPKNKILASCSSDKTIKLWLLKNRKLINILAKHLGWVTTIDISPDGQMIASGGSDKNIILWDINTGKIIKTLRGHHTNILSLAFSPDSQMIASTSLDGNLKLWNLSTGEELYTVYKHSKSINTVRFIPNSNRIISASNDGIIQIWQC